MVWRTLANAGWYHYARARGRVTGDVRQGPSATRGKALLSAVRGAAQQFAAVLEGEFALRRRHADRPRMHGIHEDAGVRQLHKI
jgi:hypothetical protein